MATLSILSALWLSCAAPSSPCDPNPCVNGGVCNELADEGFLCSCAEGYAGDQCEVDIDDCADAPCQNGGACIDGVDGVTCACAPGYEGSLCDVEIDECASTPCLHGGTCTDLVDGYTCDCRTGFGGDDCECVAYSDEVRFDDLGTLGYTELEVGFVHVTGSADIATLLSAGLGVGDGGSRPDAIELDEFVDLRFDPPQSGVALEVVAAYDGDDDGTAGRARVTGYDIDDTEVVSFEISEDGVKPVEAEGLLSRVRVAGVSYDEITLAAITVDAMLCPYE